MNDDRTNITIGGTSFVGMLTLAFIVLKLAGLIHWSWVWVLAPTWISFAISIVLIVVIFVVVAIKSRTKGKNLHRRGK